MRGYIKKNKTRKRTYLLLIIAAILLAIGTPILCQWFMTVQPLFVYNNTTKNDWIGFAGGYFGALIGAAATIFAIRITIDHEKKLRELQREEDIMPKLYICSSTDIDNKNVCGFSLIDDPTYIQEIPSKAKKHYFGIELVNLGKGYAKNICIKILSTYEKRDTVAAKYINFLEFGKTIVISFEMAVVPERIKKMLVIKNNEKMCSWNYWCEISCFSVDETEYVQEIFLELKCFENAGSFFFEPILSAPGRVVVTPKEYLTIPIKTKEQFTRRFKNAIANTLGKSEKKAK